MSIILKLERFLRRDLWLPDLETLRGWAAFYTRMLRLVVVAISDFRDGALSIRATSLVSTTLLSLVPFLAITFSVLKAFGVHEQIEPVLAQGLEPLGEKGAEISARIIEFVNNIGVGKLGALGLLGLFYTTYSLIDKIEEALNHIWRVRHSRTLARKFTDYLSVILVGPVLVFAAFATAASAQSHWLVQYILQIEPLGAALMWATALMPFLVICIGFTLLYKFVPHTIVNVSSALVGGVAAGILWQIAGLLFASFVAGFAVKQNAIYSSFAILVLFLIWVYVGWLIVLVGAQVAYYHQHPMAYLTRLRWKQKTAAFREYLALTVLVHMTQRYLSQEAPYEEEDLAAKMGVPLSVLHDIIEDFIEHFLVCRTVEPNGLTLGKPPENVAILEVLNLVCHKEKPPRDPYPKTGDLVGALLQKRDQAISESLDGMTLKMLAEEEPASFTIPDAPSLLGDREVS